MSPEPVNPSNGLGKKVEPKTTPTSEWVPYVDKDGKKTNLYVNQKGQLRTKPP